MSALSERARQALRTPTPEVPRLPAAEEAAALAQYELYVQLADRISERRQSANNFFLSISSALVGVGGYSVSRAEELMPLAYIWAMACAGILVGILWWRLITSYRDLNTAKFKIIHEMEGYLPFSPYRAEWSEVGGGKVSKLYMPVTHAERVVPIAFGILHVVIATVLTIARAAA